MFIDTYKQLVAVDSTSGNESAIKKFLHTLLSQYKINEDIKGNMILDIPGSGKPLLLNAHLDRVQPGKGHIPDITGDIVYSDKGRTTNSGADDVVGTTIIIELLKLLAAKNHRALRVIFTVEEETGLWGVKELDQQYLENIEEGIVLDNAVAYDLHPDGGVIIDQGASFTAIDLEIQGVGGHPAKDLNGTVNVLHILQKLPLQLGSSADDQIRINFGNVVIGNAKVRNQIPDLLNAYGEIRSFLAKKKRTDMIEKYTDDLRTAVESLGGTCAIKLAEFAESYSVDHHEPLVKQYAEILQSRNSDLISHSTLVGSDCNIFRARGLRTFIISTGVTNEHSMLEEFSIKYAEQIIVDLYKLLQK